MIKGFPNFYPFLIVALLLIRSSSFPRKERSKLASTYVEYLNKNYCTDTLIISPLQIAQFRTDRSLSNPIRVNIMNIAEGQNYLSYVSLNKQFFLTFGGYACCFICIFLLLRRLNRYNFLTKHNNQEPSQTTARNPSILIKLLIFLLLLYNVFNSVLGLQGSRDVQTGLQGLACKVINFPDNYADSYSNNYENKQLIKYDFNDYQFQIMNLRESFNQIKISSTQLLTQLSLHNFDQLTEQYYSLAAEQEKPFLSWIQNLLRLLKKVRGQSKLIGASLNYLRELLYWIKGSLMFGLTFLNSIYSISAIPSLVSSLFSQTYLFLLLSSLASAAGILFLNYHSGLYSKQIVRYMIIALSFSATISLLQSFAGSVMLPLPNEACNILAMHSNKAVTVGILTKNIKFYEEQVRSTLLQLLERMHLLSDGNMAYMSPEIYLSNQLLQNQTRKIFSSDLDLIQAALTTEWPEQQDGINKYFSLLPTLLDNSSNISSILDSIQSSISKEGSFGRLTVRPLGEYLESIERSLCDTNLYIWQRNVNLLFRVGAFQIISMLMLAFYLRNQLNEEYLSGSDQDSFQLANFTEETPQ